MNERIEINPLILCGKPVIKGTRSPVYLILDLLGSGCSVEKIIEEYPTLKREDILAAVQFASSLTRFEEMEFSK